MFETATELEILAEAMPEIVWICRRDGMVSFVNQRWVQYTGLAAEESLGWGWIRAVHHDDAPHASKVFRKGLRSLEPFEVEYRLRAADGSYKWFLSRAFPQRDRGGNVLRWVGSTFDIDRHRRALETLSVLADTGSALGASLELQPMLDMLLPALVPRLCDWAVIALATGRVLTVASILHRDPALDQVAQTMVGKIYHAIPDGRLSPTYAAFASGEPQIWNAPSGVDVVKATRPEQLENVKALGQRSALVVPLHDGKTIIGTLGAVRGSDEEPFTEREIPLMREIAERASASIARARIFERERLIADTLQLASLPQSLPQVPGFAFDAFYAPARSETKVGGDWYDVFDGGDHRIVLTVGDVVGSGLNAAVTMGKIRNAIRTLTLQETDPAEVLRAVNAIVQRENPEIITTAIVGFLNVRERTLTFSTAGHPAPFLRTPDGRVLELPADGLPLGLMSREHPPVSTIVQLPDDALLVFYTDGLTEETRDIVAGERLLRSTVADEAIYIDPKPARAIYRRMLPEGSHDDVALLTVRVRGTADGVRLQPPRWEARWRFEVFEYGAPSNAREAFLRFLRTRGARDADYDAAETVFGELVGNVVRHAKPPLAIELDWTGDYPVLHVQDHGPGFDLGSSPMPELYAEGGRGLWLSKRLAREIEVTRIPHYGTHVRAVLNVPRAGP